MMQRTISNLKGTDNVNNTTLELQQDLARSTPKQCVTLTHSVPSVQMYYALKTKLESCTETWLQEFLQLDGLDSLLESLSQMSGHGFTCFSDAILQIDCLSCIRSILNTNIGLEHFIASDVYTKRLATALTSDETLPKRHVFEILSAMCVYSQIGYLRVLEGLSTVKSESDQLHRFSVIVHDLMSSENIAHKAAVLTFINTLINCTPDVAERIRIRNEFIGLNLLDILSHLRRTETDNGIQLQLEIFHERKVSDEESVNADINFDFNSPQDLLDLIQSKVFGSPRMVNFVNILQDLLSIETVHAEHSGKIWQSLDGLIHHIVHTMSGQGLQDLPVQSTIKKLPEHVGALLDCISTYQDTIVLNDTQGTSNQCKQTGSGNFDNKTFSQEKFENQSDFCPVDNMKCIDTNNKPENVDNNARRKNLSKYLNARAHLKEIGSGHLNGDERVGGGSQSSLNSDTASQNRTVILRKENLDGSLQRGSVSSVNDETVVIKPNTNGSLVSDDASNCSSSGNETHSSEGKTPDHATSFYDNFDHDDMKSSTTFNISEGESMNGLNYNTSKRKSYIYNQNKVGSKLNFKCDILEEESLSFEECYKEMMGESGDNVQSKGRKTHAVLQKNIEVSLLNEDADCCSPPDVKHVNKIVRDELTAPTKDLPSLRWITLPDNDIVGREPCIWLPALNDQEKLCVDVQAIEQMFQISTLHKSQAVEEVVLLNANARLRINLFLSRLDCGAEDLVQYLEDGHKFKLTLPMLRYLNKVVPCEEEISMLRCYKGPRLELGMAEQFVLLLSDIPDYSVLIEGHLVQAEFDITVKKCKTSLTAMADMSHVVLKSVSLKRLCHLVLQIGNVLNYGTYNGDTAGFKVTTLLQLSDVKSVTPCKNMLHHVVQIIMDQDKQVLDFVKQLLPLETAASCSMEDLKGEISKLNSKLQCFMINLSRSNPNLQNMFHSFIEILKMEFKEIQQLTVDLRSLTDDLAEYFCEDVSRFNLQECFQCLLTFCKDINKCQADIICMNKIQKSQDKKCGDVLQKRLKNKLLSLEFGQNAGASSSMFEEKTKVLEKMLDQLHRGNFHPCVKPDQISPDKETGHPLEMSCIPFEGSPLQLRQRLSTNRSDNVFLDTPELVCAGYESGSSGGMTRSSTQRIVPVKATCRAQTLQNNNAEPSKPGQLVAHCHTSSPIRGDIPPAVQSVTLQRKLFSNPDVQDVKDTGYREREIDVDGCQPTQRPKRQLELPGRRGNHCRSRSDLTDSICVTNKWIEYEKMRNVDMNDQRKAPIAEPESTCNISTLNLETKGKFVKNPNLGLYIKDKKKANGGSLENCQTFDRFQKTRKSEKKSSVGGFFSRIGRAVLKPRNVYSEGDEVEGIERKPLKLSLSDKENLAAKPFTDDAFSRGSKRYKSENNGNKMTRFFNRGGLYRSSKMKKRQQQEQNA